MQYDHNLMEMLNNFRDLEAAMYNQLVAIRKYANGGTSVSKIVRFNNQTETKLPDQGFLIVGGIPEPSRISAIKIVREYTNVNGLKEAKQLVESMMGFELNNGNPTLRTARMAVPVMALAGVADQLRSIGATVYVL